MSIEHQPDFGTTKIPTPHFGRVRRAATAWKTQSVAAAAENAEASSIDACGTGGTSAVIGSETTAAESHSEWTESATAHFSLNIHERTEEPHSQKRFRPHFAIRQRKPVSAKPESQAAYPSFLVPLADASMMPPQNVVPKADSFAQTFAADRVIDRLDFRPNWEVEQFAWPQITTELLYQHDRLFDDLSSMILDSILRSQKRLAITSVARREGRTTLSISLARKFANDGLRVLIVDADTVHPSLADSVGLDSQLSWLTDQAEYETAAEFLIGNEDSQICLMPLQPSNRVSFAKHAYEILENMLKKVEPFFDLLLLEFGPVAQIDASSFRAFDLASHSVLIHNSEVSTAEQYKQAFEKFRTLDFWRFGLIENGSRSF